MLDHYRQLLSAQQWDYEALCFTYAQGLDAATMIVAFGGDPAAMMPEPELRESLGKFHYSKVPPAILVVELDGWCLGIEPNGFQGSRPEVLGRAAAGGSAVSVFWNINATNEFNYRAGGRTVVSFDMLSPELRHGADPHALDAEMDGLPFGDDVVQTYAAGLALAELVTGVRLPAELPRWELSGALLQELPQGLVPEDSVGHPALDDPFIQQVLAAPTPDKLRAIDGFLARLVAEDSGVIKEPVIRASIEAFGDGELPVNLRDSLLEVLRRYRSAHEATLRLPANDRGEALTHLHAMWDIVAALLPEQRSRGREAAYYGGYAIRNPDARLQAHVLQRCAARAKES